mgnify:CR=1 FL=1
MVFAHCGMMQGRNNTFNFSKVAATSPGSTIDLRSGFIVEGNNTLLSDDELVGLCSSGNNLGAGYKAVIAEVI